MIATLSPQDEIFNKDYRPPPIRKRQEDYETIVLPNKYFDGMPVSKSKAKARRLKIMNEAFAKEKVKLFSLTNYSILLDQALRSEYITEKDILSLNEWRKEPANWGVGSKV